MTIDLRRHHAERLRAKRRAYLSMPKTSTARTIGMLLHTSTLCSCWMCGNPRKHFGKATIQERRMETSA